MKQRILLFTFLIFSSGLFAQQVPQTTTPLITKVTATWCINCGTWGWEFFESLVNQNSSNAILIAAHDSGNLTTDVGETFADNFNSFGQPKYYFNNEDLLASRTNFPALATEVNSRVADMANQTPVANVGFIANLDNGTMTVRTKTQFFEAADGEYFLALYLVEDGVIMAQSGQPSNAEHKEIMRGGFDIDVFGRQLTPMTSIAEGTEFTNMHEMNIDPNWIVENLTLVGMIWKNEGGTFQYVNGNKTTDFDGDLTTSVENTFTEVTGFSVLPNIISSNATVQLDLEQTIENAQINIYDLNGKKLHTIFTGNLGTGNHAFEIEKSNLPTGMVFITLESAGKQHALKVIIE